MGVSCRMFLLDENDGLHCLPNTTFSRMLRDSTRYSFARFAGSRVGMADIVVELRGRQPLRVVRTTFNILSFDEEGRFEASTFERHQFARVELALAPLLLERESGTIVVQAASRFLAQGGRWQPSRMLARRIEAAALGRLKCPRL